MTRTSVLFACVVLVVSCVLSVSANGPITDAQVKQYQAIAKTAQQSDGSYASLETAYHAVKATALSGAKLTNEKATCTWAKKQLASLSQPGEIESIFYAVTVLETLKCGEQASKAVSEAIRHVVEEGSSITDWYFAVGAGAQLHENKHWSGWDELDLSPLTARIIELRDDEGGYVDNEDSEISSLIVAGRAFRTLAWVIDGATLSEEDDVSIEVAIESVADVLAQAVETEDGMIAYYDNGDSRTALAVMSELFEGVQHLSKVRDDLELPEDISAGLGVFYSSKASVSTVADAHHFFGGLNILNSGLVKKPLCVTLVRDTFASGKSGAVEVKITDIRGGAVSGASAFLVKAMRGDREILANQQLTAAKGGAFSFNFMAAKPEPGLYALEFSVNADQQYAKIESVTKTIKVVLKVTVPEATVSFVDSVDNEVSTSQRLAFGKKLDQHTETDYFHNIAVSFAVKSQSSGKPAVVQQAFVTLHSADGEISGVFPAKISKKGAYTATLALQEAAGAALQFHTGAYNVALVVGDAFVENSFSWDLGQIKLNFPAHLAAKSAGVSSVYLAKPDIEHIFRQPDSRPPATVSLFFTGLVLAPAFILFLGLIAVGAPLYPPSGSSLVTSTPFLGFIAAFGALLVLYWLMLNLFQALLVMLALAVPAMFFGRVALRGRRANRRKTKTD